MVKSNELRLGNFIIDPKTGLPAMVEGIGVYGSVFIEDTSCDGGYREVFFYKTLLNDKILKPIPVTAQILEKAGFVGDDSQNDYWLKDLKNGHELRVAFHIHDGVFEYNGMRLREDIPPPHDLQNLYFALTGEELPVRL